MIKKDDHKEIETGNRRTEENKIRTKDKNQVRTKRG